MLGTAKYKVMLGGTARYMLGKAVIPSPNGTFGFMTALGLGLGLGGLDLGLGLDNYLSNIFKI